MDNGRGAGVQSQPTYVGIHEISNSDTWVYIRTTGLGGHIMGPWCLNEARTAVFPNFPANTAVMYRIPRTPTVAATKTATGFGAVGYYVDGVAMFDMRDAFSYSNPSGTDATPVNGITGDGIWNRNAYVNEGVTFDAALAHQAGTLYHYHAQPVALRHRLGDHVTYDATSNLYAEATGPAEHSPILAWASDGYPVYGPYAFTDPTNAASPITLMRSRFVPRDGTRGTTDLNTTGRTT